MSFYLSDVLHYPSIPNSQIKKIAGTLLNDGAVIPTDQCPQLTFESEFIPLRNPHSKLVKYMKGTYLERFFSHGELQLGTFKYFQQFENDEIGDKSEGSCLIVSRNDQITSFIKMSHGFDFYVFCCSDQRMDSRTIENFGYDSAFEIFDPERFSNSIQKALKSNYSMRSKCLYRNEKVIVGTANPNHNYARIDNNLRNLIGKSQYFIKHQKYSHQNEYRFIWQLDKDLVSPQILICKEATNFCRKVDI